MGRLAYEFLKGSIPQSAAVVLCMREKHPPYMCFSVVRGFLWELHCGFGGGAGELSEEQKRERRASCARGAPPIPRAHGLGDFPRLFLVSDGCGFGKEALTAGQVREGFPTALLR